MAPPVNVGPGTPSPSRRRPCKKTKTAESKVSCLQVTLVTPFGMGCKQCGKPFGSSLWSMQRHLNPHGVSVSRSENQILLKKHHALRQCLMEDLSRSSQYLTGKHVKGYSCRCLVGSTKAHNVYRHLSSSHSCGAPSPTEEDLQLSTCGRLISIIALQKMYASQESSPLKMTTDMIKTTISTLPEMYECLVPLFYPLAQQDEAYANRPKGRTFLDRVHLLYDSVNIRSHSNQPLFDLLYDQGEKWLTEHVPLHVQKVPANYRSKLLVFEGTRTPNEGCTYTFTKHPRRLLPEFKKFLSFLLHNNNKLLHFKTDLPSVLAKLCLETAESVQHHTTVMTYCTGWVLRQQEGSQQFSLCSPSYIASMMASVLTILRASICSLIYSMGTGYHKRAMTLVEKAQQSITTNFLGSMIRRMREKEILTPSSQKVSIQGNKDILVDNFRFPFPKWCKVIPTIYDVCMQALSKVIVGNQWVFLLDRRYGMEVSWDSVGKVRM